jgi:hypothetical protein
LAITSIADDCTLEVEGRAVQIVAGSDHEFLIITKEAGPKPTFRLLRISGF